MKTALLLINSKSRSGAEAGQKAKSLLQEQGINCLVPDADDDFRDLIAQHASQVDITVIGGGDGTLNYVASALVRAKATVGILPLGTANDLCRTLGIPQNLDEAVDVLINGRKKAINVGVVNHKPFFNVANIGFGTDVNRYQNKHKQLKKIWGVLSYFVAAVKTLFRQRPFRVTIHAGDKIIKTRAIQVAIGNGCYYGGGLRVHKHADIQSDHLYVYVVKPSYPFHLILKSKHFIDGEFDDIRGIIQLTTKEVTVHTRHCKTIFADGEEISQTPADFTLMHKILEVMVPVEVSEVHGNVEDNKGERNAA